MGWIQYVCNFLSCSQKDTKDSKESKKKDKPSREEYLQKRKNTEIKCCVCDVVSRHDNIHHHYKRKGHRKNTENHCKEEKIDIPVDDFIILQKIHNKKYNRSTDGNFRNVKLDYIIYIKEYIEIYKDILKKRNEEV